MECEFVKNAPVLTMEIVVLATVTDSWKSHLMGDCCAKRASMRVKYPALSAISQCLQDGKNSASPVTGGDY